MENAKLLLCDEHDGKIGTSLATSHGNLWKPVGIDTLLPIMIIFMDEEIEANRCGAISQSSSANDQLNKDLDSRRLNMASSSSIFEIWGLSRLRYHVFLTSINISAWGGAPIPGYIKMTQGASTICRFSRFASRSSIPILRPQRNR